MSTARFDRNRTAHEALERFREQAAAKAAAAKAVDGAPPTGKVYADEPILRTGAQFKRDMERSRAKAAGRGDAGGSRRDGPGVTAHVEPPADRPPSRPKTVDEEFGGLFGMPARGRAADAYDDVRSRRIEQITRSTDPLFGAHGARGAREPLPEPYKRMRALARTKELYRAPAARVFYEQARFMADHTDDFSFTGSFYRYYPSYKDMDDDQLRGYFSWRTLVRAGRLEEALANTPLSFAFVYVYELLCGIGAAPGVEGFEALAAFRAHFSRYEDQLGSYLTIWMRDYCLYHGLGLSLLPGSATCPVDRAVGVMIRAQAARLGRGGDRSREGSAGTDVEEIVRAARRGRIVVPARLAAADEEPSDEELFSAILACCSKTVANSRFFRERPQDAASVLCGVFRRLVDHCAKHRKTDLVGGLFGLPTCAPYEMFRSALFWSPVPHETGVVAASDIEWYVCDKGFWYRVRMCTEAAANARLSEVVRAVDARMRRRLEYPHALKERPVPKYLARIIEDEVSRRLDEVAASKVPELVLDRSALGGIRAAAALTRDALLVDEERETGAELEARLAGEEGTLWSAVGRAPLASKGGPARDDGGSSAVGRADPDAAVRAVEGGGPPAVPTAVPETRDALPAAPGEGARLPGAGAVGPGARSGSGAFSAEEAAFLRGLLGMDAGGGQAPPGRPTMLSVLVDGINEKLYDLLGDTAVEFDGDVPHLVEDYREDVLEALRP